MVTNGLGGKTVAVVLEPLRVGHVEEMLPVLADQDLYEFTGGEPPDRDDLAARYRAQVSGSGLITEPERERWPPPSGQAR